MASLKKNEEKEISLAYKDTFLIEAYSPENIEYKSKIAAADIIEGKWIYIKLKELIPDSIRIVEIIIQVTPSKIYFEHSGGVKKININVSPDISWDTLYFPSFCTLESKFPSFFEIKCSPNYDVESREIGFIIKAENTEFRVDIEQDAAPVELNMLLKDFVFEDAGGTKTAKIETNFKHWEIKESDSLNWIKLSKDDFDLLKIEVENNPSILPRKAEFKIIAKDKEETITVKQEGKPKTLSVFPNQIVFKHKGGMQFVKIHTITGEYDINTCLSKEWHTSVKNDTGIFVTCNSYTKKEQITEQKRDSYRTNLTRYDTICVNVEELTEKIFVKQTASPLGLKIPNNRVGFSLGYVQREWVYQIPEDTAAFNYTVWENTKRMFGIRAGLKFDFYFKSTLFGLGINTGAYYQFMYSKMPVKSDPFKGLDKTMQEHSVYLPIQLFYRYDFTKKWGIFINGGIGIDCSMALFVMVNTKEDKDKGNDGSFYYSSNLYKDIDLKPRDKFVFTGEYGGGIRWRIFTFSFTFSEPLFKKQNIFITPNSRMKMAIIIMLY